MTCIGCGCPSHENAAEGKIIEKEFLQMPDGRMSPEIMLRLGRVDGNVLSPDGSRILYGVTYTDIDENRSVRQLFVMNSDGSSNTQITHFSKSASNAVWNQDGTRIIYLQGGRMFSMKPDGSDIKAVNQVPEEMDEFSFSPDFSKLMYVAQVQVAVRPVDEYPDLKKSTGRHIGDLMYRHWDRFVETIPHTFVSDVTVEEDGNIAVGEGKDILNEQEKDFELPTLPFGGLEQLSWSPDSRYIAYSCRKLKGKDYAFSTNTDIYLYEPAGGKCENLTEGMLGYDTDPVWSPDGRYIAWISMERAGFEADRQRLFIIDLNTREKKELSVNFAYNVSSPVWAEDGGIWFCSLVNALQGIFHVDLDANVRRVTAEDSWYDFGAVRECGERLICTNQSMARPNEIVSVSKADGSFELLTHENDDILSRIDSESYEQRWITTVDGKKMLTWVVYPPEFDKSKVYPAILFCNGGPQGTLSQGWSTRWNFKLMAQQGYIVILPNRRGTTAFGQEWTDQISGDYCGLNMEDYKSAARELQNEKFVGRMGAAGASYGGYSIYYLAGTHKGLFKAFLAHAGIFNQEQMYMMTEEMWFPKWDNGGAPWDTNPIAARHYANSPHKLILNWDTPIMVTHGEMDYRVPVEQGMAAFNAAQMMGVPSELLLFPDENHWILKPQNAVHWQREYFRWFDKWLK